MLTLTRGAPLITTTPMPAKKKGPGRPEAKDKRQVFPFRVKGSLVDKCRRKGREWLEKLIKEG